MGTMANIYNGERLNEFLCIKIYIFICAIYAISSLSICKMNTSD